MQVVVVQFLRPNGKKRSTQTDLPDAYSPLYLEMVAAGCCFEAEVLCYR